MTNSSEKEQAKVQDKELEVELKESSTDEAGETELVPELPDGYELIEKLGEGGMGRVYRVRDLSLDKEFAIKILQQDLSKDASALKRFNQEIDAAAALSHANLISIYKHGTTDNGEPYLVMDYLEGPSLAELIEKGADFAGNSDRLLDIFIQICEALAHAHENGVIHRDIKPSNIIITKSADGKDLVKIVDFGIARVIEASNRETHNLTQTGEVFGSPHYMSPEQCLGLMLTQHSDIYSLGCTLYEAITGSPPFAGANPIQLVVKHINENVSGFDKDQKRSKALKQLETITLKCLSKEMDDRYASVTALKEDLEKVKDGKPIPKYVLANRAKPTYTRSQVLTYTALFVGLTVGFNYYSFKLHYYSQSALYLLLMIFLGPGFLFLVRSGLYAYRSIRTGKNSARQWWLMIMALSAGFAGLCFAPYAAGMILSGQESYFPSTYLYYSRLVCLLHIPLLLTLFSSGICFLLFKARSAGFIYISTRLILCALLLSGSISYFAPSLSNNLKADFLSYLKKAIEPPDPQDLRLEGVPFPDFHEKEFRSAHTLSLKGDFKSAKEALVAAMPKQKSETDRKLINIHLAALHSDFNRFDEALEYLNKVDTKTEVNYFQNYYRRELAKAYHGLGKIKLARETNTELPPLHYSFAEEILLREALLDCSEGRIDKAIKLLNANTLNYPTIPGKSMLLRAILEEQTGDLKSARRDYRTIVYGSYWRQFSEPLNQDYYLAIAYAMKRLGEEEEYPDLVKKLAVEDRKIPLSSIRITLGLVDDAVKLKIDDPPLSEAK